MISVKADLKFNFGSCMDRPSELHWSTFSGFRINDFVLVHDAVVSEDLSLFTSIDLHPSCRGYLQLCSLSRLFMHTIE